MYLRQDKIVAYRQFYSSFSFLQPADTELYKLYANTKEGDSQARKLLESEGTVHASLAMALSSASGEEERELTIEEILAKSGARLPANNLKRAFVGHTAVPSQKEVRKS